MTLADRLHLRMTQLRYTAEYLAMRAEISPAYMSRLLSGERERPSDEVADRLAHALEVAPAWLLGRLDATGGTGYRTPEEMFEDNAHKDGVQGAGSKSSKRKRARKRGGKTFLDILDEQRHDAAGGLPKGYR